MKIQVPFPTHPSSIVGINKVPYRVSDVYQKNWGTLFSPKPLEYYNLVDENGDLVSDICDATHQDVCVAAASCCESACFMLVPEAVATAIEALPYGGMNAPLYTAEYVEGEAVPDLALSGDVFVGRVIACPGDQAFGHYDNLVGKPPVGYVYVSVQMADPLSAIAATA